jgi:hypothetical protein
MEPSALVRESSVESVPTTLYVFMSKSTHEDSSKKFHLIVGSFRLTEYPEAVEGGLVHRGLQR